ncbi:exo-alpha-sialidase [Carboxylicivirga caseinilyticus]|uniref:exo-alpha-sialidase n=1 Tax=Carboxylicivirga caseinilyticus TaxID=3417572 RepID=UPI003D327D16|nr:exo-alpha-sialidase [Marinilabiliaceae bacterium A049]
MIRSLYIFLFILLLFVTSCMKQPVLSVKNNLFDQSNAEDLGLEMPLGLETATIYSASDSTDKYCNGAVAIAFKDRIYCMWQSSEQDEDSHDTRVVYSYSDDGKIWTNPGILAASPDSGYCTSGGWWQYGDTLVAYINEWTYEESPRYCRVKYMLSTDGINWSGKKTVRWLHGEEMIGAFEQDPHQIASGRIINAVHVSPGLHLSPIFTDDPSGISGWQQGQMNNMEYKGDVTRELEPSSYLRKDGALVMVFRDQKSSFCKLASVSLDEGRSWSTPVITDMPDSRSKQSAGNLSDGTAYFVSNPVNSKMRYPLVLTLSDDGKIFNKAYVLRKSSELPSLKYDGKYKREGYHYPKSMVYNDCLYIAYTTNKEKVEITKVSLKGL